MSAGAVAGASCSAHENAHRALRSLLGRDKTSGSTDVTGARKELEDLLPGMREEPLALRAAAHPMD